ncbi:vWA domain-containing protein [Poriferisphaera sp. WC338]|uniref:vWA domain-containing protein n=1 Tax=Poriferisphaera sp. WC338 TaxID=3425129 RepID=UPI003D812CDC
MKKYMTVWAIVASGLIGTGWITGKVEAKKVVEREETSCEACENDVSCMLEAHPEMVCGVGLANEPTIQIALLLDTSSSMNGLINQAKSQLWSIVNQCALAQKDGVRPRLEVALFEYGNSGLPATEGYIRQVVPFTSNLDQFSAALFALSTNGGDEYCGQVMNEALSRLAWHGGNRTYRAIYIAGNEPFTQGSVPYQEVCQRAKGRNVIVNTIHCGPYDTGVSGMWQHGAALAGGKYMNINQDRQVVHIATPYDDVILQKNKALNDTYVWFGAGAPEAKMMQEREDSNAAGMGKSVAVQRAQTKSSAMYSQSGHDLVDTMEEDKDALKKVKVADLPEEMQGMKDEERSEFIIEKAKERAEIQAEISELNVKRNAYIAEKRKAEVNENTNTLGDAILKAVQEQLVGVGFEIKKEQAASEENEVIVE